MTNPFRLFAAEEGPHISLTAEKVFEIGDFAVTNSMVYGTLVILALIAAGVYAGRRAGVRPRSGLVLVFELVGEFLLGLLESVMHDRAKARKYAPVFGTFFIFIVVSNLSGLLPIVGPGIVVQTDHGAIPLFRPYTADLNGAIALAVIAIIVVQYYSIKESGFLGHLKHYFTDKPLNPINLFIGILEVFGELTRVLSLALRLFLNTVVGEILLSVFIYVGRYGSSFTALPIVLFEILVALIQAYVFTVLAATYLALAISHGHHEEDDIHEEETHPIVATTPRSSEAAG